MVSYVNIMTILTNSKMLLLFNDITHFQLWTVGRCMDYVCDNEGIPNDNNRVNAKVSKCVIQVHDLLLGHLQFMYLLIL